MWILYEMKVQNWHRSRQISIQIGMEGSLKNYKIKSEGQKKKYIVSPCISDTYQSILHI